MKNRNLNHQDDWATPPYFFNKLHNFYNFDFDPCPFGHDINKWNGLEIKWGNINFVNPPYSRELKEAFILKAIYESLNGRKSIVLLPVSTSSKIFHDYILKYASEILFICGRISFIGINDKGYVNWHLWDFKAPEGVQHFRNTGQQDNMLVIFPHGYKKGMPHIGQINTGKPKYDKYTLNNLKLNNYGRN